MSNLGLENALKEQGIQVKRTPVGDRYLIETMRQEGFNFGGEQSGHLIFHDHSTTGDGILAGLQVLALMKQKERALSDMAHDLEIMPQVLLNVRVKEKKDFSQLKGLQKLEKKISQSLGRKGRTLLRYSGTEPVLRIMLEGEDSDRIQSYAQDLKEEAEKALGKG